MAVEISGRRAAEGVSNSGGGRESERAMGG